MKTKSKFVSGLAAMALCGAAMATNTAAVSAQVVDPRNPPTVPMPEPIPVPSGLAGSAQFANLAANSAIFGNAANQALATGLIGGRMAAGRGLIGNNAYFGPGPGYNAYGYQVNGYNGYLSGGPGPYWWAELGQSAATGAVSGAVGGAVAGAVACGAAGAGTGAAVGAVGGALGGAAAYAIGSAFGLAPQVLAASQLEPIEQIEAHQALLD